MAVETKEYRAEARFQRVSPQKARLVLELIKGQSVEQALNTVAFTKKAVAPMVEKVLRSALQNANYLSQEQNLDVDVDNLYVKSAVANDGPRMKRIRPAPQGRAYRYQRRISHIELVLAERGSNSGPVVHATSGDTAPNAKVKRSTPKAKAAAKSSKPAKKKAAAK